MQANAFYGHVQRRAGLDTVAEARAVTYTSLSTLGSALPEAEAENAAAELTDPLDAWLTNPAADLEKSHEPASFVDRVGDREADDARVDDDNAELHAKAALSTLETAVSDGEIDDVRDALPGDYDELLDPPELSESVGSA